jgi:hypothetical protein
MGTGYAPSSPTDESESEQSPSIKLRSSRVSARGHSVRTSFIVSGGAKGLKGGRLTVALPTGLRWYRIGKRHHAFARLPRTVNLVIPRVPAGRSRGVAIRVVGADFRARAFRLDARLSSGAGPVGSVRFTAGR